MGNLSLKIAFRYLFSKKSHSAINMISMVSVCGVAVITMALVCTLSVYNGFQEVIGNLYSAIDPQIKIEPLRGKTLDTDAEEFGMIASWPEVEEFSPVVEDNALAVYRGKQTPVLLKGVPENYDKLTNIGELLLNGEFILHDTITDYAVMGAGVAMQIEAGAQYSQPLEIYVPKRDSRVNMANPSSSFNQARVFVSSVFAVNEPEYDNQLVLVPLRLAREIFNYSTQATAIEIKLKPDVDEKKLIARMQEVLGAGYLVKDRMMQQETAFRFMQIEKWITFLIMVFILMVATFNVIGSLSMLIIDKEADIRTLRNLGADKKLISRIFLTEGWLISILGAGTGILLGVVLCLLQQAYGWLRLGQTTGVFVVDAYPVRLEWADTLIIAAVVSLLGFLAAWYPVKYLSTS
ncbi:MAG: FtsX-like permease family protein, partial [Barnesiella sp.]